MNEGLKVKLHSALHWAGNRQKRRESSFRSCTQALSADVCLSVPCEALLWAELLLVHYGWGTILRGRGCCVLILWGKGDDTRLLPNPFMRFVHYLMGSDTQPQLVFQHRPDPCLKCAHQEEGRGKQTGGMPAKWVRLSPSNISLRQFSLLIKHTYI